MARPSNGRVDIHPTLLVPIKSINVKLQLRDKAYPSCRKGNNCIAKFPGVSETWEAVRIFFINRPRIVAKKFLMDCLDYGVVLKRPRIVKILSLEERELRSVD
jgi:hypothetical protein